MEGFQDIKDVHGTGVGDLELHTHEFLKEAHVLYPVNISLIFLILLPVVEILHELLFDGLHVEPAGADGDCREGEAGHRLGSVLQGRRDEVGLPVVVGGEGPIGSQGKGGKGKKCPEQSVKQWQRC